MMVRMAQRFEKIEPLDPGEDVVKGLRLTLVPLNGVKIRLFQSTEA